MKAIAVTVAALAAAPGAWACGSDAPKQAHVVQAAYMQPQNIVDTAIAAGEFKTLAAALQAAGLAETLQGPGAFTVFAPTDAAFAKLPPGTIEKLLRPENKAMLAAILTYHVVPGTVMAKDVVKLSGAKTVNGQQVDIKSSGGSVMVDNATVTQTDIVCSNGVIHVIDSVIMPATQDVVATAVAAGDFKTLAAALDAAALISTLQGAGPFTVLAPTDAAFAKLPAGTVESLLKPENRAKLAAILTYHVIPGRIHAADALKARTARTVEGESVTFAAGSSGATVNGAKILKTDVDASNGVIHVIDTVLMPKQ